MRTVREYLLGTLSEPEAQVVEDRYFTSGPFLEELRRVELRLISDYLDGTLSVDERKQFEGRYLKIPQLRTLVDQMNARRSVPPPLPAPSRRWVAPALIAVAASAAIIGIFGIVFLQHKPIPVQQASDTQSAGIHIFLEPIVTKGPEAKAVEIVLPTLVRPITLTADLPGEKNSADYIVQISNVDHRQDHASPWTSAPVRSLPGNGGQQVSVVVPSSALVPGDYILELKLPDGPVRESYVFRATAPPQ